MSHSQTFDVFLASLGIRPDDPRDAVRIGELWLAWRAALATVGRSHGDIFDQQEALAYLHLPHDSIRTLETLRKDRLLVGCKLSKDMMYHRKHLDACVEQAFGVAPVVGRRAVSAN
jgi:hypothetical protein